MDPGEEEEEVVKLSAADIKKYEARFSQLVVQFSKLQFNECIGKGKLHNYYGLYQHCISVMYLYTYALQMT